METFEVATFLVSYDAHKVRDYSRFYKAANDNAGVALLDSMWAFEFNSDAGQVRDWATSQAPVAAAWCALNIAPMA